MKRWSWVELPTSLGTWLLAESGHGAVFLGLAGRASMGELRSLCARVDPAIELSPAARADSPAARQLTEYANGTRRVFELELDLHGSDFDQRVWKALQRIPFGRTRSYGEVARQLGNPGLARAVGGANGRNPLPVIVPCHRVLASSGLGGYSGGLALKRRLLQHEGFESP